MWHPRRVFPGAVWFRRCTKHVHPPASAGEKQAGAAPDESGLERKSNSQAANAERQQLGRLAKSNMAGWSYGPILDGVNSPPSSQEAWLDEVWLRSPHWSLRDAKNSFSTVVAAAQKGIPQTVTKRGKPAAVVLSIAEYQRLSQRESGASPSFVEHLLGMPQGDSTFERSRASPHGVDL
jgi:antitoxin Phd